MLRNRVLRPWLVLASLLASAGIAAACPFCDAPDVTLTEQLQQADVAALVQWSSGKPADREQGFVGSTTYEVVKVVHDSSGTLAAGTKFDIVRHRAGTPGELFLMLGSFTTAIEWGSPIEVTETSFNYITQAPTKESPKKERLEYFVRFLEFPDRLISSDAYAEFAGAPYEDVAAIVDHLPREKLREWLSQDVWGEKAVIPVNRLGLYGLMLGLCGEPDDAQLLEEKIMLPSAKYRIGLDGIMAGYVLLTKEPGLDLLDREKTGDRTEEFSEHVAATQMIRFLWTYGNGVVSPDRLKQSMRLLANNPKVADLVIPDLARWGDWGFTQPLIDLYGKPGYDVPFVQRKILHFMWAAIDSVPMDSATTPEYVQLAKAFVEKIDAEDPELMRMARKTYFR
jgi:hypothetical protein